MKINGISPPGQAGQTDRPRNDAQPAQATDSAGNTAGPAAISHIDPTGGTGSQDVNSARVEEIRQAIADGRLEFRAERIADQLVASVEELLGRNDT